MGIVADKRMFAVGAHVIGRGVVADPGIGVLDGRGISTAELSLRDVMQQPLDEIRRRHTLLEDSPIDHAVAHIL